MKKLILCAVVFLSGCAINPDNAWMVQNRQQNTSSGANWADTLNALQAINTYKQITTPYTLPPPQMAQPQKPMVMPGNLKNNYVNGFIRYCVYSNGVVTSISNIDLCPLTNP